ncbi:MAG: adenylate/guanylate cyclase domain-containing protein, partial [Cyclobacteriaceae bacterium]
MTIWSPRTKWTILRILPFGIIYLVTTWTFGLVELSVHHSSESNDYFVVPLNLPSVIFVTLATFLVGALVGVVEMVWLKNLFKSRPLLQKITYKLVIYVVGGFSIIVLLFPVAVSLEFGLAPWHQEVTSKLAEFLLNISFYSTLLQMAFTILLCLIYATISDNLGHDVLTNFFTGKYHQPTVEQRIFMFLDMKDSTTLAEQLGHVQYFKLLSAYYDTFSNAIIDHRGEVYIYIVDEIVFSWTLEVGVAHANCISCFFAMQMALAQR